MPNFPAHGEQQATEQSDKLPPLHPIFERLSQVLAEQQAAQNQEETADTSPPASPDISQPQDPVALEKRERRLAKKRERERNWRNQHPEESKKGSRERNRRYRSTEHGKEHRKKYQRESRRRKREEKRASALPTERSSNLPPLHPIFERLSQALSEEQTPIAREISIFSKSPNTSSTPESPTIQRPRQTTRRNL